MSPMKRSRRKVAPKNIGLLVMIVLACGGAESEEAVPPTPTPVTEKAPAPSPAEDQASGVPMIEEGAKKVPTYETVAGPARYPENAPECPGCTLTGTWRDETGRTHRTWTSSKTGGEIQKNMLDQLSQKKWQIQSNLGQSGQYALDATKDGSRIAILIAYDEKSSDTLISAIVTP